jgi:hypothetical protein
MHYAFFLEHQLFLLLVFFCFVCCNKWLDHIMFLLEEMNPLFICQERPSFHSYKKPSVLLFYATAFGFRFRLDLRSDLLISIYQGVFLPLIFIGFHQKRCL